VVQRARQQGKGVALNKETEKGGKGNGSWEKGRTSVSGLEKHRTLDVAERKKPQSRLPSLLAVGLRKGVGGAK